MMENLRMIDPISMPMRGRPQQHDMSAEDLPIWDAAQKLEAGFLSEMLKSAGFGAARSELGGGAGEEQFASFLRDIQAKEMVAAGGIGLAESLFNALKGRSDAQR
jgi:Rod binding domain-containing protein